MCDPMLCTGVRCLRVFARGIARRIAIAALAALAIAAGSEGAVPAPNAPRNPVDARPLVELLRSTRSSVPSSAVDDFVAGRRSIAQSDPDWPTLTYLLGEVHLHRGQIEQAREKFMALASWASSRHPNGPYGDTWGGSGLAAVGLWRWLRILDRHGARDAKEVDQALKIAAAVAETRLNTGMVRSGFLPALPLLEEDTKRLLAHVASKAGRPEAGALFLDFLAVDSSGKLDETDLAIRQALLKKGTVVEQRLDLFRAQRLLALLKTDDQKARAEEILRRLWESATAPADVRAEAGYEWANSRRMQRDKTEILRVLTAVLALQRQGPVAEQALYRRATVHNRAGGKREFDAFRADMLDLIGRFPDSSLADDALFQVATEYLFRADIDNAITYFAQLRAFRGRNDYVDSAYFLPALGYIGRGSGSDLDAADRLLGEYLERYADGPFRLRCLFWRARIAERKQDAGRARALFEQIVSEAPYDYYALRARMHLETGAAAMAQNVPAGDSKTRRTLGDSYRSSRVDTHHPGKSVYHVRLRAAVASGFYRELLETSEQVTSRLDQMPLATLEESGLVPAVALLLALRQDAMAARDSEASADNWLRLAGMLGAGAKDWLIALEVTIAYGQGQRSRVLDMQRDPRYLATLYPDPASLGIAEPLARAAWPIEGSTALSQSLMYAIARQESRFYPKAVSQAGALGLFQIMPALFDSLNRKWSLLEKGGARSSAEYLLDPGNNVQLWARWVRSEFALNSQNGIAMTIMKHQAGVGNVSAWNSYWQKLGDPMDVEYRVETARFSPTRNFARGVLGDMAIIDAAGIFYGGASRQKGAAP